MYTEKVMDHFTHPRNMGEVTKLIGTAHRSAQH